VKLMHIADTDSLLEAMERRASTATAGLSECMEHGAYGMAWRQDRAMEYGCTLEVATKTSEAVENLRKEGADWPAIRAHLRTWMLGEIITMAADRSRSTSDSQNRYSRAILRAWASLMDDLRWMDP
jgi:hypothetical protein